MFGGCRFALRVADDAAARFLMSEASSPGSVGMDRQAEESTLGVRRRSKGGLRLRRDRPSDRELDARVRQVVIDAKAAGTLGPRSPWLGSDPAIDDAWARGATR